MTVIVKSLLAAAAAFCLAGTARADAFASAILDIDNFRLLRANGSAYSTADLASFAGENYAFASTRLDAAQAADSTAQSPFAPALDLPRVCVGASCPARPENDFARLPVAPPGARFAHADQRLVGIGIDAGGNPVGLHAQTRADAAAASGSTADADANTGTSSAFSFVAGAGGTLTFDFDYATYLDVQVAPGAGQVAVAASTLAIFLLDLRLGELVYSLLPSELNQILVRNGPGTDSYVRTGHINDTAQLEEGGLYQLTIQHENIARILLQPEPLPLPGTAGLLAAGLAGMWAVRRRARAYNHGAIPTVPRPCDLPAPPTRTPAPFSKPSTRSCTCTGRASTAKCATIRMT